MWQISQSAQFEDWFDRLSDRKARMAIIKRLERVQSGNLGDHASLGDGVSELRIHYGPGYRLYYTVRQSVLVLLLIGGVKASQRRDIERAKAMAADI